MTYRLRPTLPQVTVSRPIRPDLWVHYPDPYASVTEPTRYGLTLEAARREWKRLKALGFADWELDRMFETVPDRRVAA